jgi:hypothetical protein
MRMAEIFQKEGKFSIPRILSEYEFELSERPRLVAHSRKHSHCGSQNLILSRKRLKESNP